MSGDYCCLVGEAIAHYDMTPPETAAADEYNEYLVDRWLGDGRRNSIGARPLAEHHNERVVEAANESAHIDTKLDSEEISQAVAIVHDDLHLSFDRSLADRGFDVDRLNRHLISSSTMRRHLKSDCGASKSRDRSNARNRVATIEKLSQMVRTDISQMLRSATNSGELDFETLPAVKVRPEVECPADGCHTTGLAVDVLYGGTLCAEHATDQPE